MTSLLLWLAACAITAAVSTLALVPVAAWLGRRAGLLDTPGDARRIHRVPTPRVGGLAIFLGAAATLLIAMRLAPSERALDLPLLTALVGGGGLLLLVGLIDDRFGVRPRVKLAGQLLAALVAVWAGLVPDLPLITSGAVESVLFVLWVIGVTNAFNLIDGMDGVAGSVAVVALVTAAVAAATFGNVGVLLPCAVLAAAVGGFLRHNVAPAKVFLGDAGSLSIGFALAVLTVAGARSPGGVIAPTIPLCALAIPLFDTVTAIGRRWLRHLPVSCPDASHVHHRLGALGYGPRGVVAVLLVVASVVAAFGALVGLAPKETSLAMGIPGAALLGAAATFGCSRLAYHEFGEALNMLLAAPRRARRVIRTQIVVRDMAHELGSAADAARVRQVLAGRAAELGLLQLSLVPGHAAHALPAGLAARSWRLIYPLDARDEHGRTQSLVLLCERGPLADAGTAERVVRALAPIVDRWFSTHARQEPVYLPERVARRAAFGGRGRESVVPAPARARALPTAGAAGD